MLGLVATMAVVASALFATAASAAKAPTENYLALGDSLAFGYAQQPFNEQIEKFEKGETTQLVPASAFEHGYVNDYKAFLKGKNVGFSGLGLQNDGCPGETTGSMLGNGPLEASLVGSPLEVQEPEAPCAYHNTAAEKAGFGAGSHFPLHHEYIDHQSQVENAIFTIAVDAKSGAPVKMVTLNIGANDELHAVGVCEAEVEYEFTHSPYKSKYNEEPYHNGGSTPEEAVQHCLEYKAEALFKKIASNIATTLYVLRKGEEFGGVNYEGVITLVGSYDPYGRVFKEGEPIGPGGIYGTGTGKELLAGSTLLTTVLNKIERKKVTGPFEACFASPYGRFNSGTKTEFSKLQKLTNMANFNENLGKHYGEKEADGPDIHPTKSGYSQMSVTLSKESKLQTPPINGEEEYEGEIACPIP